MDGSPVFLPLVKAAAEAGLSTTVVRHLAKRHAGLAQKRLGRIEVDINLLRELARPSITVALCV